MKKRLRKRFIITTISGFSIGAMLVVGGLLGMDSSSQKIADATLPKMESKVRGKYAAENSEKAKFFASKGFNAV